MIDLHLHLDGALSLATVRKLSALSNISLPQSDETLLAKLTVPTPCTSLLDYLTCFDLPVSLMQQAAALTLAAENVCKRLSAEGLSYAELRFAPALHTRQGLTVEQVVGAVLLGVQASRFPCGLILCAMRGASTEANEATLAAARTFLGQGVVALDLAGAESLYPTADYAPLFAKARTYNIPFTIHAGEADGPHSIRAALAMGASRIGHGVRAIEDPALISKLAQTGVTLECCLTSNAQTGAVASLADHPLRMLLAAGVRVTLNTDNPTVSATTLAKEFTLARQMLGVTNAEELILHKNAREACFPRN